MFSNVQFTFPSASLFKIPPSSNPPSLTPPTSTFPYAPAFTISPTVYNHLLSAVYPVTIATVYLSAVTFLNRVNRSNDNKPWAFSKTAFFYWAVIAHNLLLAVYSGWTVLGMAAAANHTWPGLHGKDGLAGAVDSMCKLHGPRGLGEAITYNTTSNGWSTTSQAVKILESGLPDSDDVGRLWNEGLAFYGWLFYLSKFYEVIDTAIVLAKGKECSFLQSYHHAGAMISVWAGIRYMSPPIWMFVIVNAGVHTLMYTYYTLSALSLKIPVVVKRTITSLQITQMVWGTSYAVAHLFVSYSIPVSVPYSIISQATAAASSVSSAATSVVSSASIGGWLKKFALRAAGEEGLAENVQGAGDMHVLGGPIERMSEEIRWRTELRRVPCIDTSGEAFAIWLNVLYLAPLIYLFTTFFVRSYTSRTASKSQSSTKLKTIEKAGADALKGLDRETNETPTPDGSSRK
ncbi:MAG: hypothetical protein M1837_006964 [Sclerophora amabilis]|nr:MAG: hypothetical protein M1837_006964 [Sclerophora amabilis]